MHNLKFLLIVGIAMTFTALYSSCNEKGNDKIMETLKSGYKYVHHIKNGGPTLQDGEYGFLRILVLADDSLIIDNAESMVPIKDMTNSTPLNRSNMEALKLMSVGDSLVLIIPLDSLPSIPPSMRKKKNLNYHFKLNAIKDEATYQAEIAAKRVEEQAKTEATIARTTEIADLSATNLNSYKSGAFGDKLKRTASGLNYIVHVEGKGATPKKNEKISVHYYGILTENGAMFDNSFQRGKPISFSAGVGNVIRGWDEGLSLLKKGSTATFFIPSDLAYGEQGSPPSIPANAELQFYVELEE